MPPNTPRAIRQFTPKNHRRVLCTFPRYANSFGTFDHAFPLMGGVKAFMPPQGLLLTASLVPPDWDVKFVDENIRPVTAAEFAWADVVFISGMHIQRARIEDLNRRSHALGKLTVLGGPSVSAAPDHYPEVDLLHLGEAGDGTLGLFEALDESVHRPPQQRCFRTVDRLPLTDFPSPAYHLIDPMEYLLGNVQFSSGCPFTCEFCDIPALYGRNPRLKTPQQIVAELDALADRGVVSVYFVDDNFIANPRAALDLLPHLVAWQRRRNYQVRLSCEATLNIAMYPNLLALMRDAYFTNIFCGIETPEVEALRAMRKTQNLRAPILDAIPTLNRYGMEVASGIILGLDTDTDETAQTIIEFTRASQIPIATVNLLYALPQTPLYERIRRAGRLVSDEGRDSNIDFLRGYDTVIADWKRVIEAIYEPGTLYERYAHQAVATYPNRLGPRDPWRQATWPAIRRALTILARIVWRVGIRSDYRHHFWRMAWQQLAQGKVETMFQVAMVAHHLITYARDCTRGLQQASNYSPRQIEGPAGGLEVLAGPNTVPEVVARAPRPLQRSPRGGDAPRAPVAASSAVERSDP